MEKEKQKNYIIIERLKLDEESNSLSNIYDLSILNNIKETNEDKKNKTNQYFKNIIKPDNTEKINLEKKAQILKVVKKAILSSNLTYDWSLIKIKKMFVLCRLLTFVLSVLQKIKYDIGYTIINRSTNDTNIPFNISNNYNNSNNISNSYNNSNYTSNSYNNSNYTSNNYNNSNYTSNNESIFSFIYNNILFDILIKNSNIKNSIFYIGYFTYTNLLLNGTKQMILYIK